MGDFAGQFEVGRAAEQAQAAVIREGRGSLPARLHPYGGRRSVHGWRELGCCPLMVEAIRLVNCPSQAQMTMKFCPPSRANQGIAGHQGLVLTASGTAHQTRQLLSQAGPALATLLDLPLRWISLDCSPHEALANLQGESGAAADGWLGALPLDPGLPLEAGGNWAEVLAACRQPTLAFLTSSQLESGLPAAAAALLAQGHVPLIGLIQWGEPWDPLARRRDGLPWLGAMAPEEEHPASADLLEDGSDGEALRLALNHRWSRILGRGQAEGSGRLPEGAVPPLLESCRSPPWLSLIGSRGKLVNWIGRSSSRPAASRLRASSRLRLVSTWPFHCLQQFRQACQGLGLLHRLPEAGDHQFLVLAPSGFPQPFVPEADQMFHIHCH